MEDRMRQTEEIRSETNRVRRGWFFLLALGIALALLYFVVGK
jgi:hypothetical protein